MYSISEDREPGVPLAWLRCICGGPVQSRSSRSRFPRWAAPVRPACWFAAGFLTGMEIQEVAASHAGRPVCPFAPLWQGAVPFRYFFFFSVQICF